VTEPVFTPSPGGADEVISRGRRRRLQKALGAAGAASLIGGVVVLAPWGGAGRKDVLEPLRPTPTASATHTATAAASVTPSSTAAATTSSTPTVAAGETSASPVQPGPSGLPSATTSPSPVARSRSAAPITRGTSRIAMTDVCQDDNTDAAQGWCLRYTGPATARRGHPVRLSMELCRLGAFPAAGLQLDSTRETLLGIDPDWHAGQGSRFTSPGRSVTVQPGTCLTWSAVWDTRDSDGFLVLPGTYYVQVGVESSSATFALVSATLRVTD
jgi:hypothetical protein